ncbi:MAG: DUF4834 family protein [Muribaculaceae bacterium]|nr:DUF4834 family protein [Muribaculaceae bacterium]
MGILSFLFLLFIFFVLFPIAKLLIKIWGASRQFKKQFSDFSQQANPFSNAETQSQHTRSTQRRSKIFSSSEGEYVDFEEVKTEREVEAVNDNESYKDDRITDVKFTEIINKD